MKTAKWVFFGKGQFFEEAARFRNDVFVEEQGCRAEAALDDFDDFAYHAVLADFATQKAYATGRVYQTQGAWHIGRVAVHKTRRKGGVGAEIMQELIAVAQQKAPALDIVLHAQEQALGFYEHFGFVCEGGTFLEEGIPHRVMRLKSQSKA